MSFLWGVLVGVPIGAGLTLAAAVFLAWAAARRLLAGNPDPYRLKRRRTPCAGPHV